MTWAVRICAGFLLLSKLAMAEERIISRLPTAADFTSAPTATISDASKNSAEEKADERFQHEKMKELAQSAE